MVFQQFGLLDQIKAKPFAARHIVGPPHYLDQAALSILGAVASHGATQVFAVFVFDLAGR